MYSNSLTNHIMKFSANSAQRSANAWPAARLKNPQGFLPGICFVTAGHQRAQGCLWKLEIRNFAGTWMSRRGEKRGRTFV